MKKLAAIMVGAITLFVSAVQAGPAATDPTLYEKPGDPSQAKAMLDKLAGVYKVTQHLRRMDESTYTAEDVFEFVKINDTQAYMKAALNFSNGHECSISGGMNYKQVGGFVLHHSAQQDEEDGGKCNLTIRLKGDQVVFEDPNDACRVGTCGARGGYDNVSFPLTSKRTIHYMPIVLKSTDYKQALKDLGIAQ